MLSAVHGEGFRTFELLDPLLDRSWNERILSYEAATFFHTAEWARVLSEAYGYRMMYGVLRDGQRTAAVLPMMEVDSWLTGRRGVSLPFSDECVPLLRDGVTLRGIVEPIMLLGRRRNWDYVELRGEADTVTGAVVSNEFIAHKLILEPTEELQFNKVKASNRRNINKATKLGVEVQRAYNRDAMDIYYALHCRTRQGHGVPPQPRQFFNLIHELAIARGHGVVLLARFKGEWVAGAVYFRLGSKALYKFGASNHVFHHLRANNLLMWEAIRYYRETGAKELSFGRTDVENTGLLQFKRAWGAEESSLRYYRVGLKEELRSKETGLIGDRHIISKMLPWVPIPLLRACGVLLYRHMG